MAHLARWSLLTLCAVGSSVGCMEDPGFSSQDPDGFTQEERAAIGKLGPLGPPDADPTNQYADSQKAAALGQRIFFDKSYSGPLTVGDDGTNGALGSLGERGKVACASCHNPEAWFCDTRSVPSATSLGTAWTARNAPSMVNVAYYEWFGWGGKQDSLWMQGATSHESKDNTAGNRLQYVHILYKKYQKDYDALFPVPLDPALDPNAPDASRFPAAGKPKSLPTDPDGAWEQMAEADQRIVNTIISNVGKALAAYERRLVSLNAPIDRYIQGSVGALTPAMKRGLKLFIGKAACVSCHAGPGFSDNEFHNTGVAQAVGAGVAGDQDGRQIVVEVAAQLLDHGQAVVGPLQPQVAQDQPGGRGQRHQLGQQAVQAGGEFDAAAAGDDRADLGRGVRAEASCGESRLRNPCGVLA